MLTFVTGALASTTQRYISYHQGVNDLHTLKVVFAKIHQNEMSAEQICETYRRRWAIECLFKKLKQNFPLKYFLGDNVNAIEIQI